MKVALAHDLNVGFPAGADPARVGGAGWCLRPLDDERPLWKQPRARPSEWGPGRRAAGLLYPGAVAETAAVGVHNSAPGATGNGEAHLPALTVGGLW